MQCVIFLDFLWFLWKTCFWRAFYTDLLFWCIRKMQHAGLFKTQCDEVDSYTRFKEGKFSCTFVTLERCVLARQKSTSVKVYERADVKGQAFVYAWPPSKSVKVRKKKRILLHKHCDFGLFANLGLPNCTHIEHILISTTTPPSSLF